MQSSSPPFQGGVAQSAGVVTKCYAPSQSTLTNFGSRRPKPYCETRLNFWSRRPNPTSAV
jgi:hypothetical protein